MADTLDSFLGLVGTVATPFAQRFAYGADNASELEAIRERARYAQINGSGPTNTRAALQSPTSWMGFAFGQEVGADGRVTTNWTRPVLLLAGVALLFFLWRRFK